MTDKNTITGYLVRHYYGCSIKTIRVSRTTDKSYWKWTSYGQERRSARHTEYECYFDTFEEARNFLLGKCERKLRQAEQRFHEAQRDVSRIRNLSIEELESE